MTNGDMIRSLKDDALAEFLMSEPICDERIGKPPFCETAIPHCRECLNEWLGEEFGKNLPF